MSDFICNNCDATQDTTDWIEHGGFDGDEFVIACSSCDEDMEVATTVVVSYQDLANRY